MTSADIDFDALAAMLAETAQRAGQAIRKIYAGGLQVREKADASPVTDADEAAEKIILADLARVAPNVPVIAEEAVASGSVPATDDVFFLVDPLDGTKEFVRGTGEFTVNIALVHGDIPRFGLILAPALGELFLTIAEDRAVRAEVGTDTVKPLDSVSHEPLQTRDPAPGRLVALASRSHMNETTERFLETHGVTETFQAGSSLKFCRIAQGLADVYPRLGPTCEWDTAAGDAILRAAGGVVLTEDGTPLRYGKAEDGYRNPGFIAWGRQPVQE
ncbi:3'(2'),5'-bisphosphate nucleotidase [Dichotomicrobium thermohalophilum]|uniref:3'(2'),5'-bisphosphate nucleotidase CysQ n=2 Tax=Dichotomicrobium thermohalophilum TaxID=933063 RepID=A0A397Q7Q1_9HYPH|nr:3'(2'),5'-bisphosphate nucleotidase [Dichotomicrobium thermohalophilum]